MENILTADDLSNDNFYQAHTVRGDEHSQECVFDKGSFAFGLPKGAATINPQAIQTERDSLERLTNEFLESGGAITICPPGKQPKFRFGAFKPSSGSSGACRSNDLSRRRWYDPLPNRREERDLIRKAKSGDERAKQKLVEINHRYILTILTEYSGPPHNDLMAAALFGFSEAISRFNENRSYRLPTYAKHWIRKYIRLAIKDWRREGAAGETRQDRYIFSNPGATAEQVVAAVGGRLENAERAIARLDGGHEHYDTTEGAYDEDDNPKAPRPATSHEMSRMYGCLSRYQLSPQLRIHEQICGPHRNHRLGWIDEFADYHIAESRRRLAEVGRRQYALELVDRERIRIGYRAKAERYLYRDDSGSKDYASRVRVNLPSVADSWAILCQEKNDHAQKLKEVAASHTTIQKHDPYKELRPPKQKSRHNSFRAAAVCFVWRDDRTELGKKSAKLMAARLSRPRQRPQARQSDGEIIWRNIQTTTPEKSLPLPCQPMLRVRHGLFVKKNFSVLATFAELRCSAI